MISIRFVRGEHGLLPCADAGFTIKQVKEWRAAQSAAGLPETLEDFYTLHGACRKCMGEGVRMIGWSEPAGATEQEAARELGLTELPLYRQCEHCGGSGKISGRRLEHGTH